MGIIKLVLTARHVELGFKGGVGLKTVGRAGEEVLSPTALPRRHRVSLP
jgi:hypothetical protein